jgi:hypothetical protein
MRNKTQIIFILSLIAGLSSCGIYSFTGASIPPEAKTFSVDYFKNNAANFNPTLSQDFTEMLQNKLSSQTRLNLTDGKGDLQFKGQIIDYSVSPVALIANETAAQNRLTIKVKVEFINELDEKQNFSQTFSRYQDYPSEKLLTEVEPEIVPVIIELLTDDIFQKAVVNW